MSQYYFVFWFQGSQNVMDVDQWLRTFAYESLAGINDRTVTRETAADSLFSLGISVSSTFFCS